TLTAGTRCNAAAIEISSGFVIAIAGDVCAGSTTGLKRWDMLKVSDNSISSGSGGTRLGQVRRLATATLVGSGVVLVAGGNSGQANADKLTFSGGTIAQAAVSGAQIGRLGHTATLLPAGTNACPANTNSQPC